MYDGNDQDEMSQGEDDGSTNSDGEGYSSLDPSESYLDIRKSSVEVK